MPNDSQNAPHLLAGRASSVPFAEERAAEPVLRAILREIQEIAAMAELGSDERHGLIFSPPRAGEARRLFERMGHYFVIRQNGECREAEIKDFVAALERALARLDPLFAAARAAAPAAAAGPAPARRPRG